MPNQLKFLLIVQALLASAPIAPAMGSWLSQENPRHANNKYVENKSHQKPTSIQWSTSITTGVCATSISACLPTEVDNVYLVDAKLSGTGPQIELSQTFEWDSIFRLNLRSSIAGLNGGQITYTFLQHDMSGYRAAADARLFIPVSLKTPNNARLLFMGGFAWNQTYGKTKPIRSRHEDVDDVVFRIKVRSLAPCAGLFLDMEPMGKFYTQVGLTSYFPTIRGEYPLDVNNTVGIKESLKSSRHGWGLEACCCYSISPHLRLQAQLEYKGISSRGPLAQNLTEDLMTNSSVYQRTFSGLFGIVLAY